MAVSLLGMGLALGGSSAAAQPPAPPPAPNNWVVVPVPQTSGQKAASGLGGDWRSSPGASAQTAPRTVPALQPPALGPVTPPTGVTAGVNSALAPTPDLQPVLMQAPVPQPPVKAPTEETSDIQVQLEPPGLDRVTRRESEASLQERMRQEARGRRPLDRIDFPPEPILSTEKYAGRSFPPTVEVAEPNYVCHQRLYFEEKNSERYGWDLGIIQPLVSAAWFYGDLALLPYHIGTAPCRKYECSAGYCLPGDSVPYLLYPPDLSLTGAALETGGIFSLFAIFPG